MTNTKLFDYLQSMSSYELNRFQKFVQSPYFNEDDSITQLVTALLPLLKSQTIHQEATEKTIWKKVFGGKRFARQTFNRLLSDTVKKAEQFLTADAFNRHPFSSKIALLEIMNKRRLDKHFPELFRFTQQKLLQAQTKDSDYFHNEFQLHQLQNNFIENKNQRTSQKNLQQVFKSLDVFYFIQKLKFFAAAAHYGSFLNEQNETTLIREIIEETAKPEYGAVAHLQAYRTIALTFSEPENANHFHRLTDIVKQGKEDFAFEELQSFLAFAVNYCIRKINLGDSKYLRELFVLYCHALQQNLLMNEKRELSQWEYKNIVTTALRIKEFKWTEKFLTGYKNRLSASERDNAYTFNLARFYFATKNYGKVLSLLQQVEYNDIFYQLDSKTTLLKTYYEMGEALPIHSFKDSFRVLLRRKKLISEQQKQNYMNLLKFTIRLHKADVRNRKEMLQLKKEIEAESNIADKSWLLEKTGELI